MPKPVTVTAAQAVLPESIPTVQRPLPGEIAYPLFTRLGDSLAGWRDSTLLRAMLSNDTELGVTPWMRGLHSGLLTSIARDRRETIAIQAPLRHEAAGHIARYRSLQANDSALRAAVEAEQKVGVDGQPISSGEAHEKPEQILRRRQREAAARVAAANDKVTRSQAEREGIVGILAQLKEAFDFHEQAYLYRVEALRDFYAKRQSVYVRCGLRGRSNDGNAPVAPEMVIPEWRVDAFPTLTEGK